jgi:hypothetical protein
MFEVASVSLGQEDHNIGTCLGNLLVGIMHTRPHDMHENELT